LRLHGTQVVLTLAQMLAEKFTIQALKFLAR
jgi:hypothetical protein